MAYTLYITPTQFIASNGKLDSSLRYMRKTSGTPDLRFVVGQNMDVSGGGVRYVRPDGYSTDDGSYNGSFTGSAGIPIALK